MASKPKTAEAPANQQAQQAQPSNAVATTAAAQPPSALAEAMKADAGKGVSNRMEDNIIPLIYSLQDKSKYTKASGPDYVRGAVPGMLYLRNADEPLIDGKEGFLFQLCHFHVDYVEWMPRASGGGIVGRHTHIIEKPDPQRPGEKLLSLPDGRKVIREPDRANPRRIITRLENNNEIVETRNHVGFVLLPGKPPMAYAMPFKGADHNVSKAWMTQMNNSIMPGTGQPYPSWAHIARVKLVERHNASGDWYGYAVNLEGWVSSQEEYDRGKQLHEAVARGVKKVADDDERGDGAPGEDNTPPQQQAM